MKKLLWFAALDLCLLTLATCAQGISPLVSEFNVKPGKAAHGSFYVQSNLLTPVAYVVEANKLVLDKTGRHVEPLSPSERITISSVSGRLGPKEVHEVDFTIVCDSACNILFRTAMVTGKTSNGFLTKVWLDHAVYIAQSKHPRQDALLAAGVILPKK